jgi:hypothetical protein
MPVRSVVVVFFLAVALLPACSDGGSNEGENNSSGIGLLTLTEDGCTYEGDETVTGPRFGVNIDNQSSSFGYEGLSGIPETYVDVERERLEDGRAFLIRPPSYFTELRRGGIAAGLTGTIFFEDATEGVYALWCATEEPPGAIYVVALLDVS